MAEMASKRSGTSTSYADRVERRNQRRVEAWVPELVWHRLEELKEIDGEGSRAQAVIVAINARHESVGKPQKKRASKKSTAG